VVFIGGNLRFVDRFAIHLCALSYSQATQEGSFMTNTHAERRRFVRIAFDAKTELSQAGMRWPVTLVDLSLKGLLIEKPQPFEADSEQPFTASIHLNDDTPVVMEVVLVHDDHNQLGFNCSHIDVDSISHLRRLIELNLGDEAELERELKALLAV
jgi:hypothetical protein